MSTDASHASPATPAFVPTRWTVVLQARGTTAEAQQALAQLCESYYQPVLRFLQSEGRTEDAARELTQEFFAGILGGTGFRTADPERGRFRSYLLGTLKHFLADRRKRERRLKRGGGATVESLDATSPDTDEELMQIADPSIASIDRMFDRQWAMAVMAQALEVLQREFVAADKGKQFEHLKPWLLGEVPSFSQAETARRLAMTEGAVKVVIYRLRKRFREIARATLVQTLPEDSEMVDDELRHLVDSLM